MEISLAKYLDITVGELYEYIDYICKKKFKGENSFKREVLQLVSDLEPIDDIDELYVYHLSRRLDGYKSNDGTDNLRTLLLNESPISKFLRAHGVTFVEKYDHLEMAYLGERVELEPRIGATNDIWYLRSRLGYNKGRQDYCFNGFALRDQLMKNNYTRNLYRCPEIIDRIARFLNAPDIKEDYSKNSTFYCYTYKLDLSDIIFDGTRFVEKQEKLEYYLVALFNRLSEYLNDPGYNFDHENPIIRINDNSYVSDNSFIEKEEITLDMMK